MGHRVREEPEPETLSYELGAAREASRASTQILSRSLPASHSLADSASFQTCASRSASSGTRTQVAAGLGGSYVRDLRQRLAAGRDGRYDLAALLRILRALDVAPAVFFGKVFGSLDPIALTQLETRRLGEPPEIVARVGDLLLFEEWQPPGEFSEHVRDLDAHRYRDAREAGRFARTDLEQVAAGLRPLAWGIPLLAVYGSALRMTEDHDAAQQTLVLALERAEPTGDQGLLGDLLQRLAYAVADHCGDYGRASRLSARATDYHLLAGDMNAVGKTFVDRGIWLRKLDRLDGAVAMERRALELLATDEHRNRFAAFQMLGLSYRELGEPERAHQYASLAAELAPRVGPWMAARLLRLRARLAVDRRQYQAAEAHLREAIEVFQPISSGEAALETTELVRVLLLLGRGAEAHTTASTMARFIIPLEERSPVAAAAALDLLRCGQVGRGITLEMVDRVAAVLDEERARPPGRARSGR
ncbi:MAG: hypothetical protein GY719_24350 [bacterium]|nr:hypothetical protein [bacterium]